MPGSSPGMAAGRHCEKRSDEAIHSSSCGGMDCFAALAMTAGQPGFSNRRHTVTSLTVDPSVSAKLHRISEGDQP
jgi:hypothetical protein